MREKIRDRERLEHILEAINNIIENQKIYSFEEVKKNSIIFYGFVKYLEIIGEAVYMLTKEFRESHPEVNWKIIEKMRHVLVHGYYQIQHDQLWDTLQNNIPELKPLIERYLKDLSSEASQILEESQLEYGLSYEQDFVEAIRKSAESKAWVN